MIVRVRGDGCSSFSAMLAEELRDVSKRSRSIMRIFPEDRRVREWSFADGLSDQSRSDAMLYLFADAVSIARRVCSSAMSFDIAVVVFDEELFAADGRYSQQAVECASAAARSADITIDCDCNGDGADLAVGNMDVAAAADYVAYEFPSFSGKGVW